MPADERFKRYELITGEDTYHSQTAQDPKTSRLLRGFVPSIAGTLEREAPLTLFTTALPATAAGGIVWLYEYDHNLEDGSATRDFFCVTGAYEDDSGDYGPTLYCFDGHGRWDVVAGVTLKAVPQAVTINNLMHLSDGTNSWLFDGTTWVRDGFPIPLLAPTIAVTSQSAAVTTVRPTTLLNGWGPQVHEGDYEGGTDQGHSWQMNAGPTLSYFNPDTAFDGNESTCAYVIAQHTHQYCGCVWSFAYTPSSATEQQKSMRLKILSEVPQNGATFPGESNVYGERGLSIWGYLLAWQSDALSLLFRDDSVAVYHDTNRSVIVNKRSAGIWYSLDGGATWTQVYNVAERGKQWDVIDVPYGTDINQIQVMAFADSHDDMAHYIYEVKIEFSASDFIETNRYYWLSWADETPGRVHESSSTPISAPSGEVGQGSVLVRPNTGTCVFAPTTEYAQAFKLNLPADFDVSTLVGWKLYTNVHYNGVNPQGFTIRWAQRITGDADYNTRVALQEGVLDPITDPQPFLICPARATHWHLYASDSEGSKMGYLLASVPVTQFSYTDMSPWMGEDGSLFQKVERPYRNDPTPPSKILSVHKYRIFRRRETQPNFFHFTAKEEVEALLNGACEECVPGTDKNTLSDLIDEQSYPKTTTTIRNITSHADALYIGTEKEIIPLLGESLDSFSFSEVTAIRMGMAGRFAAASTHHGLAFLSYDRKFYLYPILMQPWSSMNTQENLVEIGLPKRDIFRTIDPTALDQVWLVHYHFGVRDWLVVTFPKGTGYQPPAPPMLMAMEDTQPELETWVFDFDTKGWFKLQKGYLSLAVWETRPGQKVLVGGGTDGHIYVIDDQDELYKDSTGASSDWATVFEDDFNRANGAVGNNWTMVRGAPTVSNNECLAPNQPYTSTILRPEGLPDAQFVEAMLRDSDGAYESYFDLLLRVDLNDPDVYLISEAYEGSTFWYIYDYSLNGGQASGRMSTPWAIGDVARLEADADGVRLYRNGLLLGSLTERVVRQSGRAGVHIGQDCRIDNFRCGGWVINEGISTDHPEAVFRPALIDFGNPDINHRFAYVEYECTNPDLPVSVNYWLDPKDVDDPGEPRTLMMSPVLGANRYRGFPNDEGGNVCHRMLIEFRIAQGPDAGALRAIKLAAEPVTDLILEP